MEDFSAGWSGAIENYTLRRTDDGTKLVVELDTGHIIRWNHASDDWHLSRAENDLRPGGQFNYRMEACDGSFGFDFEGTYEKVEMHKCIESTLGDGRKVQVTFDLTDAGKVVMENFEVETMNSVNLQRQGRQAILDNFGKYVELY